MEAMKDFQVWDVWSQNSRRGRRRFPSELSVKAAVDHESVLDVAS